MALSEETILYVFVATFVFGIVWSIKTRLYHKKKLAEGGKKGSTTSSTKVE